AREPQRRHRRVHVRSERHPLVDHFVTESHHDVLSCSRARLDHPRGGQGCDGLEGLERLVRDGCAYTGGRRSKCVNARVLTGIRPSQVVSLAPKTVKEGRSHCRTSCGKGSSTRSSRPNPSCDVTASHRARVALPSCSTGHPQSSFPSFSLRCF